MNQPLFQISRDPNHRDTIRISNIRKKSNSKKNRILKIYIFSVKSPEIKMGRSYEERVSSYRKTFGPEGGQGRVQETREQVQYRYGHTY